MAGAAVLLVAWSFAVPVFESPDEVHHWQYARYLHDERRLPQYGPNFVEANSPPVYYALLAPIATHSAYPPSLVWSDSEGSLVVPVPPRLYHNAGGDFQRYWPIRLGRLLTVLMSVATIWLCWRAGDLVGGSSAAVLAASLVAFLPQFTFRGSTISNDALVTTMSAATIVSIVTIMGRAFTWRAGSAGAFALAAAYLSKISAISLCAPFALALWWSEGPARVRLTRLVGVMGLAALIVAPWSLYNVVEYGDPFASGAMRTAVGHIISERPLSSPYFWTTFPAVLSRSFVGVFGWMNLGLPEAYYWIYWILGIVGLVAIAVRVVTRNTSAKLPLVLAAIVVLNLAVVIHINRSFEQPQGRYMFVALPALAVLIAMGLAPLARLVPRGPAMLALCLAGLNVFVLGRYVIPAYFPPVTPALSSASVEMSPSYLVDLLPQADGSALIGGADPQVGFKTRLEAAELGFLAFELSGNCTDGVVDGTVYFETEDQPASEAQQMVFRWQADRSNQLIRIPLLAHPQWKGTITGIRIDPMNTSLERHQGERVEVQNVRLVGNLSLLAP
jgi:4-amino-4-deoxy-L-arabinose transferase-like glycosyltransferase